MNEMLRRFLPWSPILLLGQYLSLSNILVSRPARCLASPLLLLGNSDKAHFQHAVSGLKKKKGGGVSVLINWFTFLTKLNTAGPQITPFPNVISFKVVSL